MVGVDDAHGGEADEVAAKLAQHEGEDAAGAAVGGGEGAGVCGVVECPGLAFFVRCFGTPGEFCHDVDPDAAEVLGGYGFGVTVEVVDGFDGVDAVGWAVAQGAEGNGFFAVRCGGPDGEADGGDAGEFRGAAPPGVAGEDFFGELFAHGGRFGEFAVRGGCAVGIADVVFKE